MKKASWIIIGVFSILIGLYPIIYFLTGRNFGLLASKPIAVLTNNLWNIAFYAHIVLGGISLLIGWLQFSKKLKENNILFHRNIGKIYIISVLISAITGLYIAMYATGGIVSKTGFSILSIVWFTTTLMAYNSIREGNIQSHEKFMFYSYACCFAAVTLRIWLPILVGALGDFTSAYRIISWFCWIPNIIIAYFILKKKQADTQI